MKEIGKSKSETDRRVEKYQEKIDMAQEMKETQATNKTEDLDTVVTVDKSKNQKKVIAAVGVAVVLILAVIISVIAASGNSGKKLRTQLDLGNKYLEEMDYEQAKYAFQAALEIDPKNADAYGGLIKLYAAEQDAQGITDTYLQAAEHLTGEELDRVEKNAAEQLEVLVTAALNVGEYGRAENYANLLAQVDAVRAESLRTQIVETIQIKESQATENRFNEVQESIKKVHSASNGNKLAQLMEQEFAENLLKINEFKVFGMEMENIDEVKLRDYLVSHIEETGFNIDKLAESKDEVSYGMLIHRDREKGGGFFSAEIGISYSGKEFEYGESDPYGQYQPISMRDIHMGDTIENTLKKIGFDKSGEIAEYVNLAEKLKWEQEILLGSQTYRWNKDESEPRIIYLFMTEKYGDYSFAFVNGCLSGVDVKMF